MNLAGPNRLATATSPYLQQHAHNPVDWWPWCAEALERARREDKPILLSVGYSACHWCHVMAHESFEDIETARLMNELFINIKVDREERPDLDKIYQNAHYILSQRNGGWPLTIFLNADDQTPFFSGTYFPPEPRHGLPGFKELLTHVSRAYHEQRDAIGEQNRSLKAALAQLAESGEAYKNKLDSRPITEGKKALVQQFDKQHGGFGNAPKFPHPDNLALLMENGTRDKQALYCACLTLEKMALGGINDQLGGGFCRYSVDSYWMIPHFEKMLYDNGPLLSLYVDAWQLTDDPLFKSACISTAQWVTREMQSEQGGYYSSLDADSEGVEGKYYAWHRDEVQQALSEEEYEVFAQRYGLNDKPNFEGKWHLHTSASITDIAEKLDLDARHVQQVLEQAQHKLMAVRGNRAPPARDDKILTSWNALMIYGMVHAGRILNRPDWIDSAARALAFIRGELWLNGRLLAVHKDGVSHLDAYLDDHVLLIKALLEMLKTRWDTSYLNWAVDIAELLINHFEDNAAGGFFFTSDDHEQLIQRPKTFTDDAMPSGNGVAAQVFGELARLSGDMHFHDTAEKTLRAAWNGIRRAPHAHASLLLALGDQLDPPETLIIRARQEELPEWREVITQHYSPKRNTYFIPSDETELPDFLARHLPKDGGSGWLCQGYECLPPVNSPQALADLINQKEHGQSDS